MLENLNSEIIYFKKQYTLCRTEEIKEGDIVIHDIHGECNVIKLKDRGENLFINKLHISGGSVTSLLSLSMDNIKVFYSKKELVWSKSENGLPPVCPDNISIELVKNLVLVRQSNGNIFTATNYNNQLWFSFPHYFSVDNTEWRTIL